ncbi:MAG: tRNA 2-thiouridine(34) synthase MnmA [Sphaerobacter sp.]|nr:tRNA 2-thiouridine(34) synthase MnmA [Sphaerobacter sp.]
MPRILVALSGGVDSAVAALTLKTLGWEPIGIHLRLFDAEPDSATEGVCCGDQAAFDARWVAHWLGIPFYVRDLRETFGREVAAMTVDAYARAETPNPCIACNHRVRIPALLRLADSLGIPAVATGHYVRKVRVGGRWYLAEARDQRRDQSYALYRLTDADLARLEFPLGALDKETVRERARAAGLPVADKPASVDLCFAKSAGGIGRLVAAQRPETGQPGPLVDEHGRVVGRHPGVAYVTIGQRSGLQWDKTTPERRYVAAIDPATRTVTVAPRTRLLTRSATLRDPIWHGAPPARAQARIRYQGPRFEVAWDGERVHFLEPAPPLAPGQAVVLYDGPRVLGGGTAAEVARGG